MVSSVSGKKIIIGITGGIAAYKAVELVRLLKKQGALVRVVMTQAAQAFITPLTLQAVSGEPVLCGVFASESTAAMDHIELARWADLIVIAPASAHCIARLSHGLADDLLATLCVASTAPVAVAPAMNRQMWENPATVANRSQLITRGMMIWGPGSGLQACGEEGAGRLLEPTELMQRIQTYFAQNTLLHGQRILITAGPTHERIDPVRYLSNYSSGKMGYALAQVAAEFGGTVTLVSGPAQLQPPANVTVIAVESAQDMLHAVMQAVQTHDIFISAAAVADYAVANPAAEKIKKSNAKLQLQLVRNPDIVAAVAALENKPFTVGFALETDDVITHAQHKLHHKKLDMIVANTIGPEQGFASDTNAVTVLTAQGESLQLQKATKYHIAQQLWQFIAAR